MWLFFVSSNAYVEMHSLSLSSEVLFVMMYNFINIHWYTLGT